MLSGFFIFIRAEGEISLIDTQTKEYQNLSYIQALGSVPETEMPQSLGTIIAEDEPITDYENTVSCDCITFAKQFNEKIASEQYLDSPFYLWKNYEEYGLERYATAQEGRLIVTTENRWYWHIGVVVSASEEEVFILDKNFAPCRISERSLEIDSGTIVGYLE